MIVLEAESRAVLGSYPVALRLQVLGGRIEAMVPPEDWCSPTPVDASPSLDVVAFRVEAVWDHRVPPRPILVLLFAGDYSKLARVVSFRGRRVA